MSDLVTQSPFSRRDAVVGIGKFLLAGSFGYLFSACDYDIRELAVDAISWEPSNVLTDFALAAGADLGVDYIDTRCHACSEGIRVVRLLVCVATSLGLLACPECAAVLNTTVIVSAYLLKQLSTYGFQRAVGFARPQGGYAIYKVGPTIINGQQLAVTCSAVAASNQGKLNIIDSLNCQTPEMVAYGNRVASPSNQQLFHVWRRDGQVTDTISVKEPLTGYHESRKCNPLEGIYLVTTETSTGLILDSKHFSISADRHTSRILKAA